MDLVSGYSSTLFGHAHPRLVAAAREQVGVLTQLVGWRHPWRDALEARLAAAAPTEGPTAVWLSTTGARAVEVAWKAAYAVRPGRIVPFDLAYHGRSAATAWLSHTRRLKIVDADVDRRLTFPRCHACPVGRTPETCGAECLEHDASWIEAEAESISAVLVEPMLGARGYWWAPPIYFQRLRELTRRLGILMIDDEVQMGLGRMGTLFACQAQGWQPDLIVLGKSLGGGMVSLAATLGPRTILDAIEPGVESETFAAQPLACRLGLESLGLLLDERLIDRAAAIHEQLAQACAAFRAAAPAWQAESHGASAVYWYPDPSTDASIDASSTSHQDIGRELTAYARTLMQRGVLVHLSGLARDRLVLIPPLVVSSDDLRRALDVVHEVLSQQRP